MRQTYGNLSNPLHIIMSTALTTRSYMVQGAARLPEFERPPVSEVAISVEFSGIDSWRAGHAGLYWRRIKSEYPASETQPPLPSQIERFDQRSPQGPVISMGIVDPNSARFWFLSGDGTKLVQVQRDRFIINWRKVTGTEVYPRYKIRDAPPPRARMETVRRFYRRRTIRIISRPAV